MIAVARLPLRSDPAATSSSVQALTAGSGSRPGCSRAASFAYLAQLLREKRQKKLGFSFLPP